MLHDQRRLHQFPVVTICIDGHEVLPICTARNLNVYFDAGLCMSRLIDVIATRCFEVLHALTARHPSVHISALYADFGDVMHSRCLGGTTKNSVLYGLQ
jgi:hypothetical protein